MAATLYWVLKHIERNAYVARPGSGKSYVKCIANARQFKTREAALAQRCPGNEVPVPVYEEEER